MILIPAEAEIYSFIHNEPEWQEAYADSGSVLFVKETQIKK
jgi:hypothetical protein